MPCGHGAGIMRTCFTMKLPPRKQNKDHPASDTKQQGFFSMSRKGSFVRRSCVLPSRLAGKLTQRDDVIEVHAFELGGNFPAAA